MMRINLLYRAPPLEPSRAPRHGAKCRGDFLDSGSLLDHTNRNLVTRDIWDNPRYMDLIYGFNSWDLWIFTLNKKLIGIDQ